MSLTVSTRKLSGLADQPQKTKEMSLTVSTRKLPGLTDQPQRTPATILHEKNDLSSNEVGEAQNIINIAKERDMDPVECETASVAQNPNQKCIYSILTKSVYKVTMKRFWFRGLASLVPNIRAAYYIITIIFHIAS